MRVMTAFSTDDLRIHAPADSRPVPGEFVLYWLQTTRRAHDNWALNYAVTRANELGLPVLVFQHLRHDYPWASDRFHTFLLESAAGLAEAFEARGIQYVCHVDRTARAPDDGPDAWLARSPLPALTRRAALVVTDFFPAFVAPRQLRALRRESPAPVLAIDSATLLPLRYHTIAYSSARHMRPVLMRALPDYLHRVDPVEPRYRRPVALPFDALSFAPGIIPALITSLPIDHAVGPVPETPGGTAAGRRRLATFVETGLPRYEQRNDPTAGATSRLSPYLHFGCLSIQEVLLATQEAGPRACADAFLDEALTWRELSYNFTYFAPRTHRTLEGLPAWARTELANHTNDRRAETYTLAELEASATASPLWNACQSAYTRDGWMPGYLRMLWGKSVIGWCRTPAAAMRFLEHLNNKYALDGRDPCTYSGLAWCFGKFDRPFFRRPVFGVVRYMSLGAAERKFDVPAYIRTVSERSRSALSSAGSSPTS